MKKRIVAMILTGMMVFTLNGCGTQETDAEEKKETQENKVNENETNENVTEINENETETQTSETETNENANEIKEGENLVIPISELSEKAAFYPIKVDGMEMEVIAGKDSEGKIRTAFNTCQVCYDSGNGYYKQLGEELVCQNCGNSFTMDQVGETSGGCNPVPILEEDRTVTDSEIEISYDFFKESSDIFANWKR